MLCSSQQKQTACFAAYATFMAVLGIVVNPAAGLLFDYFGFLNVFAFTSFLGFPRSFHLDGADSLGANYSACFFWSRGSAYS